MVDRPPKPRFPKQPVYVPPPPMLAKDLAALLLSAIADHGPEIEVWAMQYEQGPLPIEGAKVHRLIPPRAGQPKKMVVLLDGAGI